MHRLLKSYRQWLNETRMRRASGAKSSEQTLDAAPRVYTGRAPDIAHDETLITLGRQRGPNMPAETFYHILKKAPLIAYKYVDLNIADIVAAGSLRIGTIEEYRRMEGRRGDPHDITVSQVVSQSFSKVTSDEAQTLDSLGIGGMRGSSITFENCTFIDAAPNINIFCLARDANLKDEKGKPQAVFRVNDVEKLGHLLRELMEPHGDFIVASVEYGRRERDPFKDGFSLPNPWLKPTRLAWEKEVRFAWLHPRGPVDFIILNDPRIGQILERVR